MKPYSTTRNTRGSKYALSTNKSPTTKRALRVDKKRARRAARQYDSSALVSFYANKT